MGPTKMTPEDQQFNINFVAEVKKHPCLFDSNSTEYKQAQMQDKAWLAVSASVNEGVEMCKKRWRNLRCCMTRYLKSVRDNVDNANNLRRKPYYLFNHMQFVIPFLKVKEGESSAFELEDSVWVKTNSSGELGKHDDDEEPEHEIETIEEDDHQQIKQSIIQSIKILPMNSTAESQSQPETTTTYEIIEASPAKQARIEHVAVGTPSSAGSSQQQQHLLKHKDSLSVKHYTYSTVPSAQASTGTIYSSTPLSSAGGHPVALHLASPSSSNSALATHRLTGGTLPQVQQITPNVAADADNNFFKSLIPDIQSMSMDQKRKLKIGILRLIDEILSTT